MGTHWPILETLSVSGIPRLEDVQKHGYTAVLSVEVHPSPPEVINALPAYHMPLPDGQLRPPAFSRLLSAVALSVQLIGEGHKVLVHCKAGRDRSCTTAALVARHYYGWDGPTLLAFVRERRPRAINNQYFDAYIQSLPPGFDMQQPGPGRGMR